MSGTTVSESSVPAGAVKWWENGEREGFWYSGGSELPVMGGHKRAQLPCRLLQILPQDYCILKQLLGLLAFLAKGCLFPGQPGSQHKLCIPSEQAAAAAS